MRLLTEYELDLVAGGNGTTDDAQLNGNDNYDGSWYGAGNSGGGGNPNNTSNGGHWAWFAPASYFGDYPPGGNGTWRWVSAGGNPGGGSGGEQSTPPSAGTPNVILKDVDCAKEEAAFSSALEALRTASPTAAAVMDRVLNGPYKWTISLVNNVVDNTEVRLTNINWDPFSGLEFTDADGKVVRQSAMVALAHEFAHAEYWNRSDADSYAHAMEVERAVAAELNAYYNNNAEAARPANGHRIGTPYVTASSTTTQAATGGRPSCA
ncbi:MAG: hypothetical protein IH998_06925 [Proteobacteria bacterium]|nr:hypothetical protein [Pseudomonadota bacterium]